MKMHAAQSAEDGLFDCENGSYYSENENVNNGIAEYGPSGEDVFSEYLWMENEEEFDKEVMQRLEEEALMEQCIEAMLADETSDSVTSPGRVVQGRNSNEAALPRTSNDISSMISNLKLDSAEVVKGSNLNPLAAEFVPGARSSSQSTS
ncbi:polyadenylate-binding protein-interacting protein 2 isoform X2 [Coccinella septempunctata]|uniref:polyadenylate-binding protein-interacting protein 2 isoform X2 n=1 Tax=Coccinella septempunctata TaxID=41139 RepID=UPI001D08F402|nr:polyadenylate-binding protein-interacting protein 2 isoform X2 [Coccinella septempunctata]